MKSASLFSFFSNAILSQETSGFANQFHGWFALYDEQFHLFLYVFWLHIRVNTFMKGTIVEFPQDKPEGKICI